MNKKIALLFAVVIICIFSAFALACGGGSSSGGKCSVCNGTGQVLSMEGGHAVREPCRSCNGTGQAN